MGATRSAPSPKRAAWLWPREHGGYAMMGFPQATALLLGNGAMAAVCLSLAVLGGFLAHEPAQVALGRRGIRRRREAGDGARLQAAVLTVLTLDAGVVGLAAGSAPVRVAAVAILPLAALALRQMISGTEKSVAGELLVALTFAAASVPTALAGGLDLAAAAMVAGVWFLAFALGTLAVRALITGFKTGRRGPGRSVIALALGLTVAAAAACLLGGVSVALLGVLPPALLTAAVLAGGLTPRRLRTLGWSMVTADVLVLAVLWAVLR